MIEVERLTKAFGTTAVLDRLDFRLQGGTLTALVGGNGAGKSTLLKVMGGALAPDGGCVHAGPRRMPVRSVRDALRAGVRVSYQEGSLIPAWTVGEHFSFRLRTGLPPWAALAPNVAATDRVRSLNQADQQKIEIARSTEDPDATAVLADEPTAGLDPVARRAAMVALRRAAERGCAVLWVTHDLEAALTSADRILVLRGGRIVRDSDPSGVRVNDLIGDFTVGDASTAWHPVRAPVPPVDRLPVAALLGCDVRAGEVLGVSARHAAGVSPAMRALAGLSGGAGAASPFRQAKPRLRLRYMSRERATEWLFDHQNVRFNLATGTLGRRGPFERRRPVEEARNAEALAARFSIPPSTLNAPIETLSGGNRQKVVLARMAAADPELLMLDEPFSGVDAPTRQALIDQLHLIATAGAAVVIYSQELPDLIRCADRLVSIREGGDVSEIDLAADAHVAIEQWLARAPASQLERPA